MKVAKKDIFAIITAGKSGNAEEFQGAVKKLSESVKSIYGAFSTLSHQLNPLLDVLIKDATKLQKLYDKQGDKFTAESLTTVIETLRSCKSDLGNNAWKVSEVIKIIDKCFDVIVTLPNPFKSKDKK